MPRSRFAEVIEGPADRFGLDLDPGLTERMVEDTALQRRPAAARLHAGDSSTTSGARRRWRPEYTLFPPVAVR